ncbi:hypothetical protein RKE29_04725 [Streptomyces sp. B1866]|uniref:DUF6879 family protein n=1 Tax=Streptomyces sp. B1866 TaxID=3075431 RepID=UPI00288C8C1B|nr:DUF6879 family protein [Streptomyces sp. B1866]MDT3395951.1 hypothetical protein [Streptomyces sp. B1866]
MLDLLAPDLAPEQGERLTREVYRRDFRQREDRLRDQASWKLERRQHFEEQGSPSRDALRRGEWSEALRLLEERRGDLLALAREDERRGRAFHRVRVVAEPLTPYMQWQLHSLRQRAEFGERIRIIDAGALAAAEDAGGLLPELVVLGDGTLYQVIYDETGVPDGAIRYTDHALVRSWENYIQQLYEAGEDLVSYFERKVSRLRPPAMTGTTERRE